VEIGGLSHRSPFVWLLRQAERYAHHWADLITAAPSKITAYLTRDGVSPEDILHVPNPADTSLRTDVSLPNFLVAKLAQLKVDQRFIVAYAGALGEANAMESAVRSLQLVRGPVHLLVVGHGSQREKLIQIARETGVDDRISFFSGLTRHQVHALLAEVDAAYAGVKNLHLYTYGASLTKLNDYMQAGTPIIYSSPEMDSQVKRARCGLECAAENPVAIAACIDEMIALDVPYRRMLGQRGLQWIAENQSVDVVAAAMLTRMEKLVAGHSGSR
jgi:glycosyltransferase involved in cell wall biosynthesis